MTDPRLKATGSRRFLPLAVLSACAAFAGGRVLGQDAPAQSPPVPAPAAPSNSREAELEARLRQMEAMVNQLSQQVQALSTRPAAPGAGPGSGSGAATGAPGASSAGAATGGAGSAGATGNASPAPPNAPGQSLPPNPPPSDRFNSPAKVDNRPARVKFGPGFEIRTEDDEFIFQFHNLTQFEFRGFEQGGQNPVHDTFDVPRQWFMFSGRITKPIGYFVSLAHGFDNVTALDFFIDYTFSPKFQVRMGRMKTPFTYEFLVEPIQGLKTPERSVFFNNFGQNRDVGVMAFGRLFNNQFDYAVGVYNGNRNGFLSNQDAKAVSGFINWRPWGDEQNTLLENFNIGGSVFAGEATQAPQPQVLRTNVATSGNNILGVPFLAFNSNVRESGFRAFWDLHTAWYYRQFSLIGEWAAGDQRYAPATSLSSRTGIPVQSFYLQGAYLLTGETQSSTGVIKPLHPFSFKDGGIGAIELFSRYAYMDVDRRVFSSGLADQNLWSNRLFVLDTGLNWWFNQYTRMTLDWQHSEFGDPVQFNTNRRQLTSDLFLVRFQLYF